MHTKSKGRFEALVKSLGTKGDSLLIDGFASTPDPDRGCDIVLPTAFTNSLATFKTNPVLLWDHGSDPNYGYMPIGQITEADVEEGGLHIKAEISDPVIAEKIRRGELRTMSFGYEVPEGGYEVREINGVLIRVITELELYEISVVAIPMNPNALFSMAKSFKAYFAATKPAPLTVDQPAEAIKSTEEVAPLGATDTPHNDVPMNDELTAEVDASAPETEAVEPAAPEAPEAEVKAEAEAPAETPEDASADEDEASAESPEDNEAADAPEEKSVPDTAETTPPSETKSVTDTQAAEEPKEESPVEEKSISPKVVEPESKALEVKMVALETRLSTAESTVESVTAELKKADQAIAQIADLALALKKRLDETPVETPYAVSQFAPKTKKGAANVWDSFNVRTNVN